MIEMGGTTHAYIRLALETGFWYQMEFRGAKARIGSSPLAFRRKATEAKLGTLSGADGVGGYVEQQRAIERGDTSGQSGSSMERAHTGAAEYAANFPNGVGSFAADRGGEPERAAGGGPAAAGDAGGHQV